MNADQLLNVIGYPLRKKELLVEFHNTGDIISAVIEQHNLNRADGRKLARHFNGSTDYLICQNLWKFAHYNLNYIPEKETQNVKSISKILVDAGTSKGNDCKHFAGFIAVILEALNVPFFYRFTCEDGSGIPTHVYVVSQDANDKIICDGVLPYFDSQAPFTSKIDIDPKKKRICYTD